MMPQVYQEPLCRRHHSSLWSSAALFRAVSFVLAVVLSFLLAYTTGGFWRKVGQDVSQPAVHYSGDALLILEVRVVGAAAARGAAAHASCMLLVRQQLLWASPHTFALVLRAEHNARSRASLDHLTSLSSSADHQQAVSSCAGGQAVLVPREQLQGTMRLCNSNKLPDWPSQEQ